MKFKTVKRTIIIESLTILVTILFSSLSLAEDLDIEKYEIQIPKKFLVPYSGIYSDHFSDGFTIGIGSGLCYVGRTKDGAHIFYAISDRGPNANAPKYTEKAKKHKTKMFPAPNYTPGFGALRISNGKATLESFIPLKNKDMKPISGRPIPKGFAGATGEIPLNDSLEKLDFDIDGLDTEGIDIDRHNKRYLWICDEYGPFIAKIDGYNGNIIKKYGPGNGLPMIIAKRQPNRGFEGISVTPSGKIVAAIQSICDVDGKIKKSKATFIRILLVDPETGDVKQYAYPHDKDHYALSMDAKIGDLHAISDTKFILIERGKNTDGKTRIPFYVIDIADATDITGKKTPEGKELESIQNISEIESMGINYISKTKIFDLKDYGWEPSKAEGVALLPNKRTIAVTSDNDFGFNLKVLNPALDDKGKHVKKINRYTVDEQGKIKYNDKPVNTYLELKPTKTLSQLWLLTLPKAIDRY